VIDRKTWCLQVYRTGRGSAVGNDDAEFPGPTAAELPSIGRPGPRDGLARRNPHGSCAVCPTTASVRLDEYDINAGGTSQLRSRGVAVCNSGLLVRVLVTELCSSSGPRAVNARGRPFIPINCACGGRCLAWTVARLPT
jgi:hypothetical protein